MLAVSAIGRCAANALSVVIPTMKQRSGTAADDELALELEKQMCCIRQSENTIAKSKCMLNTGIYDEADKIPDEDEGQGGKKNEVGGQRSWSQLLLAALASLPISWAISPVSVGFTGWYNLACPMVKTGVSPWAAYLLSRAWADFPSFYSRRAAGMYGSDDVVSRRVVIA
jgi:hypothetical protein